MNKIEIIIIVIIISLTLETWFDCNKVAGRPGSFGWFVNIKSELNICGLNESFTTACNESFLFLFRMNVASE